MTNEVKPNLQVWAIERLVPYALNSKKHTPDQVKRIAASIKEFGWTQPIVVDKDGVIIAGHGRRLAGMELGHSKVPVWVRDDLDEMQVRALRLADNRVAEGEIDTELFRQELATLDFDLVGMFDAKELEFSTADLGDMNLDAFIEDVDAAVKTQEAGTKTKIEALQMKGIPLSKAFGFTEVKGANQIHVARFMAVAEAYSGKKGEDALIEYMQSCLAE